MSGEIEQTYVLPDFIEHLPRHSLVEVRAYIEDGALLETWCAQADCRCLMCQTYRAMRAEARVEHPDVQRKEDFAELPSIDSLKGL